MGDAPRSPAGGPLGAELAGRMRDRLLRQVEAALVPLDPAKVAPPRNALEAWERFLALQAALEEVERRPGPSALTASWYGGVRDTVWSSSCALFNDRRIRSAWVAHMMFTWVADRAEILGDFPATLLNRENARSALSVA